MGGVPKPTPCFLDRCIRSYIDGNTKIYIDPFEDLFYSWDSLHGEIEVFNKQGKHAGVLDPDGNKIKFAVRGRKITKPN